MKTGIELIAHERKEQIEKHGRTIDQDVKLNTSEQLVHAAWHLMMDMDLNNYKEYALLNPPSNWGKDLWIKMVNKPRVERLKIAGALIAAEIDRLNATPEQ